MLSFLQSVPDGVIVSVRVQPRASRSGVEGIVGDALKVRLNSAPVDGKANHELIATLAEAFELSKSRVSFKSGMTSKTKRLHLSGITVERVEEICRARGYC